MTYTYHICIRALIGLVIVLGVALPATSWAVEVTQVRLQRSTLDNGYTVGNATGTAFLGLAGGRVQGVDSALVTIQPVALPENYPVQPGLEGKVEPVGDIFRMRLGKGGASSIHLTGPIWFSLSYPGNLQADQLQMRYWDEAAGKWRKIKSSVNATTLQVQGQRKKKNIVVRVFRVMPVVSFIGEETSGVASYYFDGNTEPMAANNDHPYGSIIRVTNTATGAWVDAKVVSTGPFVAGRVVDLNAAGFEKIANISAGLATVSVKRVQ